MNTTTSSIKKSDAESDNLQQTTDYFRARGLTIAEWANEKGYNKQLVYLILRGERKCLRGESFRIAQELKAM